MKKVFLFIILLSLQLFSRQYDETLLSIEAKLFPKIVVLEQHIKQKVSSHLSFVIITQEIDQEIAQDFKSKILEAYPDKLLNKKIQIEIKSIDDVLDRNLDAIIFLHVEKEKLASLTSWTNRHNIVTLSYDSIDLDYGVVASIYIGKSTKPYLNTSVIKKYNFIFDSYLLRLSKFKD